MTAALWIVIWCVSSVALGAFGARLASLNRRRYPTVGEKR